LVHAALALLVQDAPPLVGNPGAARRRRKRRANMVVFECEKCNETLKKPKVEKHLQMCGSWHVTCIDCNKKFAWDEWAQHTKCISENEKYQGGLFQEKSSTNKGEKKQNAWTDNVREKIEDPNSKFSAQLRGNLEKLLEFDNIPRKQKPFGNFVKNSLKLWDERRISEIWDVIAAANAPAKPAPAAAAPAAAAKPEEKKWAGWKRALDDELKDAGGELSWRKVQETLVKRHKAAGQVNGKKTTDEQLALEALASIPETYLSRKDELVRLPEN